MRIAFATDVHLDFLKSEQRKVFISQIKEADPAVLLIGGDIANGKPEKYLQELSDNLDHEIFYVRGNHDYYQKNPVHMARKRTLDTSKVIYAPNHGIIDLENVSLVAADGWGDARNGFVNSAFLARGNPHQVDLSDFYEIPDLNFVRHIPNLFIKKLNELGDEAAAHFEKHLPNTKQNIIILTHVPPFVEACFYHDPSGQVLPSDEYWAPYFSCKAVGDTLLRFAEKNPDNNIVILCGHTHASADVMIRKNLRCIVGAGSYTYPTFQIFNTEGMFLAAA